jgi:anti-sigma B factor antagonist
MKIETRRKDGVTTLIVSGEVDAREKAEVGAAVRALIAKGETRIVFDFAKVTYMGSTGVGCLLAAQKDAAAKSGGVAIVRPPPTLRKMFRTLGLEKAFPIYDTREAARRALRPPGRREEEE